MKISNKTRVVNYNLTILVFILLFLLLYASRHILSGFVPSGTLKWVLGITSVVVMMSIVFMINGQKIFEFDNSGEIISIKSYRWFQISGSMRIVPVFEMSKSRIIKMKVHRSYLKNT